MIVVRMADPQTFFNFRTVCMFILAKIGWELNDNDFTKSYKFMTETGFTNKPGQIPPSVRDYRWDESVKVKRSSLLSCNICDCAKRSNGDKNKKPASNNERFESD